MAVPDIAMEHARRQVALGRRVADEIGRMWRLLLDLRDIAASWARAVPRALGLMTAGQTAAAAASGRYVAAVAGEYGIGQEPAGLIRPEGFAGTASDGRDMASLLYLPAITALTRIGAGVDVDRAAAMGAADLDMIARTQIADAGRVADGVAITAQQQLTGYVRMIVGDTCSRCIILAGRWYRWNDGFERHPRCDCRHIPVAEAVAGDPSVDPEAYFETLTEAEQNRVFTQAGAAAIRAGADMGRVVNARRRRSMYTAGGRLYTREATTRRGAGRRVRLMPEQIYKEAADRDDAIRLLRLHGYITSRPAPPRGAPPRQVPPYEQRLSAASAGQDALDAPRLGLSRRPRPAEHAESLRAVNRYTGAEYNAINKHLRGQRLPYGYEPADVTPIIAGIDEAMAGSRLDRDILVYRGVVDALPMFGDRLDGNLTGAEWTEAAFISTTVKDTVAALFASSQGTAPVVMRILAPAGTPAVEASGMDLEAEVLLGRGRRLRVVADRGRDDRGVRLLDVEVLDA